MLQQNTISTSTSSTPTFPDTLDPALLQQRVRVLVQNLALPHNRRAFLFYLIGLGLILAGMTAHILLSAALLKDKLFLAELQAEHALAAQQTTSLVWEISQETSLDKVKVRAQALGYDIALDRRYVIDSTE